MGEDFAQLESQIKKGQELKTIGKMLEQALNQGRTGEERSKYLYLYGLSLIKSKAPEQAVPVLEEAVKLDGSLVKGYFLLFRVYYQKKNYTNSLNYLEKCIEFKFKERYCRKMEIKISYQAKDFPVLNNLIADYWDDIKLKNLALALQVESLCRLKLYHEAEEKYQLLISNQNIRPSIGRYLAGMISEKRPTPYQELYQANLQYFQGIGLKLRNFGEAQYKVSRFLDDQMVYDRNSGRFLMAISEPTPKEYKFSLEKNDILLIYNTDNIKVFEHLEDILNAVDTAAYRKQTAAIPVFVAERHMENWELMIQLYDFSRLGEWRNLHYCIGIDSEELQAIFLDEYCPLPNIFYGTGIHELQELLAEVKKIKDEMFRKRMEGLREYYQNNQTDTFQKILVVASIHHDSLDYYGRMLQNYLIKAGYTCVLHTESAPYYKFTGYADLKLLEEYHPDLVIHMFAVQEELEVFKALPVPFTCWLIFNKRFTGDINAVCGNQHLMLTGNDREGNYYYGRSFQPYQISYIPLPVEESLQSINTTDQRTEAGDIGIIADLDNLDMILKNIVELIYGTLHSSVSITKEDLSRVFREVYFELYTNQISKSFSRVETPALNEIIAKCFQKRDYRFDDQSFKIITEIVKKEMENPLLKLLQANWAIGGLKGVKIEIYGEGWDRDPNLRVYHKGRVDFLNDLFQYQAAVLHNKINLYIGNRIRNNSYMQPDLINGIALGGFFLVNDLTVKQYGGSVLEPFGGLLETYGNREEMLEKIRYFLDHDADRNNKARLLREHVLKNFGIEKIAKKILTGSKETLNVNLH